MTSRRYKNFYVKSNKSSSQSKIWIITSIVLFNFFLIYCFIFPKNAGILGLEINKFFTSTFGISKFLLPLFSFYWIWYILKVKRYDFKYYIFLTFFFILLLPGVIKVILLLIKVKEIDKLSGWIGNGVFSISERIFGEIFGSITLVVIFLYVVSLLFEISLYDVIFNLYNSIVLDIQNWLKEIKNKPTSQTYQPVSRYIKQRETQKSDSTIQTIQMLQTKPDKSMLTSSTTHPQEKEVVKAKHTKKEDLKEDFSSKIETKTTKDTKEYILPKVELLSLYNQNATLDEPNLSEEAENLEKLLKEFDISAKVVDISCGPVVTMYELQLEPGIKVQSVSALRDNIALGMKASSIRIIAPLPGKGTIGIEIPRKKPQIVSIREVLESEEYQKSIKEMKLPIALGKTTDGKVYVDDIVPMPHILIAGSTGSGKSVCIHSMIISLLYSCKPDYLKLVLIDPKRLELMHYNGIPHLYDPNCPAEDVKVITSSKEAARVLNSLVKVMDHRYEKFASYNVRNIDGYNELMITQNKQIEPYIVVIIDEFADLMLTSPKEVEDSIQRLAQMARAVGIHLVLATQRPSVDVITGVIKANFSCRIAFQVLSKTDSRVILDSTGAEELLGRGDMLYLPTGAPKPIRLQGAYVSEKDIESVVNFIKSQGIKPQYEPIVKSSSPVKIIKEKEQQQTEDLYAALVLIKERKRVSQDLLKAYFRSSAKATDILSLLEVKGFIYKPEGTNRWSINFDKVEEAIAEYEKNKKEF
ncbi:MAG: DNA translocase FtsK [Endomicrobia bacterium]|nr:DNA translocase FtsK [Endomicrobiia bacterium]